MSTTQTRREAMQRVAVAGGALTLPGYVNVVRGATDSGNPELTVDAQVPVNTSLTVTTYEITDDGETTEEVSVPNGENTFELVNLTGTEDNNYEYYLELYLETSDDTLTPQVHQADLILPEGTQQQQDEIAEGDDDTAPTGPEAGLVEIADSKLFQTIILIGGVAGGAVMSRNASLPAVAGLTVFFFLALTTDIPFLNNLLYLALGVIILSMSMAAMSFVLSGEGS